MIWHVIIQEKEVSVAAGIREQMKTAHTTTFRCMKDVPNILHSRGIVKFYRQAKLICNVKTIGVPKS